MGPAWLKLLKPLAFLGKCTKKKVQGGLQRHAAGASPAHLEPVRRKGESGGPLGSLEQGHRQLLWPLLPPTRQMWGPQHHLKVGWDGGGAWKFRLGRGSARPAGTDSLPTRVHLVDGVQDGL